MDNTLLFREIQKFRQWWAWILVIVVFIFTTVFYTFAMLQQLVFKIPFGTRPMSDTDLLIQGSLLAIFGILFLWLFLSTKLITEVHTNRICLKFYPFQRSFICFEKDRIKTFKVRKYSPLKEYGGWGIRKSKRGFAYNMQGNTGVELTLIEGVNIMIGTQNPDQFKEAMEKMLGH